MYIIQKTCNIKPFGRIDWNIYTVELAFPLGIVYYKIKIP